MIKGLMGSGKLLLFENRIYLDFLTFNDNLFAFNHWHICFSSELPVLISSFTSTPLTNKLVSSAYIIGKRFLDTLKRSLI